MKREVEIVHTYQEGTRLSGTTYGDGAWSMLAGPWEWRPRTKDYRHLGSVRHDPDLVVIARTKRALECIGFTVKADIELTFTTEGETA